MTAARIVLVTTRVALPPTRGQQVRTDEWLRALAGHDLALVCPRPEDEGVAAAVKAAGVAPFWYRHQPTDAARALAAGVLRGLPAQEALYRTRRARTAMARAVSAAPVDLVVVQTVRCGWAAGVAQTGSSPAPLLFDAIDSMALHYRHRARSTPFVRRWAVLTEARRCERRERSLARSAAVSVAVAERDLAAFAPPDRGCVVPVSGRPPTVEATRAPREPVVLLSGNLGYRPTVEAAAWFGREVWPRVRRQCPDAIWILAGARPASEVRRLADLPGVELHEQPADLGPFLARASVAVAPMATGSGIPLKVIEAWAAGVPVVAAPWAIEGLGAGGADAVAVADGPEAFAAAVVRALSDSGHAARLAAAGRGLFCKRYHPDRVADEIRSVVRRALETAPSRRP